MSNFEEELEQIIEQYNITLPRRWEEWSYQKKLDYVGERILMSTRTSKKHSYLKEQGWLSSSQLERRQRREVYGRINDFRDIPVQPGNPNVVYHSPYNSVSIIASGSPTVTTFIATSGVASE